MQRGDRREMDYFELLCCSRIPKVSWTKVTNKESLKKVQPKYSLEAKIMKLRHGFVGQVLTKSTSMEKHYYDRKN